MDGLMSIGEFSATSGLSPKQLRSYAVTGLLVPAAVDADSGYRYYAPAQLPAAQVIDALRRAGMPLAEITSVLADRNVTRLDAWAGHLRVDAGRKRQALDEARELLIAEGQQAPIRKESEMVTTRLHAAARTETGPVRENNEDATAITENLVAVADGMGGHAAGEVASTLATRPSRRSSPANRRTSSKRPCGQPTGPCGTGPALLTTWKEWARRSAS